MQKTIITILVSFEILFPCLIAEAERDIRESAFVIPLSDFQGKHRTKTEMNLLRIKEAVREPRLIIVVERGATVASILSALKIARELEVNDVSFKIDGGSSFRIVPIEEREKAEKQLDQRR